MCMNSESTVNFLVHPAHVRAENCLSFHVLVQCSCSGAVDVLSVHFFDILQNVFSELGIVLCLMQHVMFINRVHCEFLCILHLRV